MLASGMHLRARSAFGLIFVVLVSSEALAASAYKTDFNLNESMISEGGVWRHNGLDWTRVETSAGLARGTQDGNGGFDDSYAYLSGFSADQTASGVVHLASNIDQSTTHEVEILLRWADAAHSARGYECNFAYNGQYADIVRWNGAKGDFTFLVPTGTARIPGGLREGDTVSARIVGHVITTFVNGVEILSVADDTYNDGNPGIGFWRGAPSGPADDFAFTHFSASSLSAAPVPVSLGWRNVPLLGLIGVLYTLLRRKRSVTP